MHCPKCIGKLQDDYIEKYPVEVCYVCKGIWFDKDELEKILIKDSNDTLCNDINAEYEPSAELKDLFKEFDDTITQCPKCQDTTMTKKRYHGVMIDVCPKCGGVWLDGGEIFKVRHPEWKNFIMHSKLYLEVAKQAVMDFVQGRKQNKSRQNL